MNYRLIFRNYCLYSRKKTGNRSPIRALLGDTPYCLHISTEKTRLFQKVQVAFPAREKSRDVLKPIHTPFSLSKYCYLLPHDFRRKNNRKYMNYYRIFPNYYLCFRKKTGNRSPIRALLGDTPDCLHISTEKTRLFQKVQVAFPAREKSRDVLKPIHTPFSLSKYCYLLPHDFRRKNNRKVHELLPHFPELLPLFPEKQGIGAHRRVISEALQKMGIPTKNPPQYP